MARARAMTSSWGVLTPTYFLVSVPGASTPFHVKRLEQRSFVWDARPAGKPVRARGDLMCHVKHRPDLPRTARGHAELSQPIGQPAAPVAGRRLGYDECSADPEQGRSALSRHRRPAKTPGSDHVKRAPEARVTPRHFGPAFPDLDSGCPSEPLDRLPQKHRPPLLAVNQYPVRLGEQVSQHQSGHTAATAQVGGSNVVTQTAR